MEILLENLSDMAYQKIVSSFDNEISKIILDRESDTISVSLKHSLNGIWGIDIKEWGVTITDSRKQVVLKSAEFTRILIQ